MPSPSSLSIATSSLLRLLKEEKSYHAEMEMQQKSLSRLESSAGVEGEEVDALEGNREFLLRQEKKALEETKAVFPRLREKIEGAVRSLEGLIASAGGDDAQVVKAREAIEEARAVVV